jgi:hypothetical protein
VTLTDLDYQNAVQSPVPKISEKLERESIGVFANKVKTPHVQEGQLYAERKSVTI